MNVVILDYSTGDVDFRNISVDINDGEAVERYLFVVLGYKESQVSYMFGDNISINIINEES